MSTATIYHLQISRQGSGPSGPVEVCIMVSITCKHGLYITTCDGDVLRNDHDGALTSDTHLLVCVCVTVRQT